MKKIADIILDRLNTNTLSEEEIFGFLAYYYSDLVKCRKSNKYTEKYRNEIEFIFKNKKEYNRNYISLKAKELTFGILKHIKDKNLPHIAGETYARVFMLFGYFCGFLLILFVILLIFMIITQCIETFSSNTTYTDAPIGVMIKCIISLLPGVMLSLINYYFTEYILKNHSLYCWQTRTKKIPK